MEGQNVIERLTKLPRPIEVAAVPASKVRFHFLSCPASNPDISSNRSTAPSRGWSFGCSPFQHMSQSTRFSRRKFMKITAVAAAAGPMAACIDHNSPWRCLSADEARTLEAMCERIIPADQDPGAAWAGVVNFIDRQLVGPYRKLRRTYRLGLAGTDGTSLEMFGKAFVALTPPQQDSVLQSMEKGQARGEYWKQVSARSFFNLVVNHTMQGFYGDPRHGGNRERASWKMLRLPYPPVLGREHGPAGSG